MLTSAYAMLYTYTYLLSEIRVTDGNNLLTKGNNCNFMYTGKLACRKCNNTIVSGMVTSPVNKITNNVINRIGPAENIPTQ